MSTPVPVPEPQAELQQIERFEFRLKFPVTSFAPIEVDEPTPTGSSAGPSPIRMLAAAVGHCMSSTLYSTLERAHVPSTPIETKVSGLVGRNAKGRLRVQRLELTITTAPLREEDRERFAHATEIFEDFCTVSGAVREGITIVTTVQPRVPAT